MKPEFDDAQPSRVAHARAQAAAGGADATWMMSRRQFIGTAAAVTVAGVLIPYDESIHDPSAIDMRFAELAPQTSVIVKPAVPLLPLSVERDADMCLVDFTFCGFSVVKSGSKVSLKATAKQTSTNWIGVVIELPPQSIAEGDYWVTNAGKGDYTSSTPEYKQVDPTPIVSQVAGPSRIAYTFKQGDEIPLPTNTFQDLLNWSGWTFNVVETALSGSGITLPIKPNYFQTAIECPLALILSPVAYQNSEFILSKTYSEFNNRTTPFPSPRLVTECWTTTLTSYEFNVIGPHLGTSSFTPEVAVIWANDMYEGVPGVTSEEYIDYDRYEPPPP